MNGPAGNLTAGLDLIRLIPVENALPALALTRDRHRQVVELDEAYRCEMLCGSLRKQTLQISRTMNDAEHLKLGLGGPAEDEIVGETANGP